jgi:hypothetical protein
MFCVSLGLFPNRVAKFLFFSVAALMVMATAPSMAHAQRTRATGDEPDNRPMFSDFKGVRIGMPTEEARKKLGSPRDKSAEQDFYLFNDNQAVQVFYDKSGTVSAISIDFMEGANGVPAPKDIPGTEPDPKPDGSVYKMVRYPKAGYWVSYSKTAGNSPTITITMQRIEH